MQSLLSVLILVLLSESVAAGEFWEKKPFHTWNGNEIRKILTDSPWARRVILPSQTLVADTPAGPSSQAAGTTPACRPCEANSGPFLAAPSLPQISQTTTTTLVIRWLTALPVKQAIARAQFGDEVLNSPKAAELIERTENVYIVSVAGVPFTSLPDSLEELKAAALLKTRSLPPVTPVEVQARNDGNAATVVLVFAKEQNGRREIRLEDGQVEVALKLGMLTIKGKFKLKDMVYSGKLEM